MRHAGPSSERLNASISLETLPVLLAPCRPDDPAQLRRCLGYERDTRASSLEKRVVRGFPGGGGGVSPTIALRTSVPLAVYLAGPRGISRRPSSLPSPHAPRGHASALLRKPRSVRASILAGDVAPGPGPPACCTRRQRRCKPLGRVGKKGTRLGSPRVGGSSGAGTTVRRVGAAAGLGRGLFGRWRGGKGGGVRW